MKKILTILAGVLALAATSCVKETLTMFDPSKATAPVLNSYSEDEEYGELVGSGFSEFKIRQTLRERFGFEESLVKATSVAVARCEVERPWNLRLERVAELEKELATQVEKIE